MSSLPNIHDRLQLFVAGEVATALLGLSPTALLLELRQAKAPKVALTEPDALRAVLALGLPLEGGASARGGVAALDAPALLALLEGRRRRDLSQPLRLALLKLDAREAARRMAGGDYGGALPVALGAVRQGEALFRAAAAAAPGGAAAAPPQMFPLYLLAAQAFLGLRRPAQCGDALRLAGEIALRGRRSGDGSSSSSRGGGGGAGGGDDDSSDAATAAAPSRAMLAQLARLSGQLAALRGRWREAARCFARDAYLSAQEHGPRDARTSLAYHNLGRALAGAGDAAGARACGALVADIWLAALAPAALGGLRFNAEAAAEGGGGEEDEELGADFEDDDEDEEAEAAAARTGQAAAESSKSAPPPPPVGPLQLLEVVDALRDVARLWRPPPPQQDGGGGGGSGGGSGEKSGGESGSEGSSSTTTTNSSAATALLAAGLALLQLGEGARARVTLAEAGAAVPAGAAGAALRPLLRAALIKAAECGEGAATAL